MTIYREPSHPWITRITGPLYMMSLPSQFSDEELTAALEDTYQIGMSFTSPYGWVCDLSHLLKTTASQRKIWADNDKRMIDQDRRLCAGAGVFVTSKLAMGVVTAVFWISPPVYPLRVFNDRVSAEAWARQQLAAKGVELAGAGAQ